jgi:hypothetical protein
LVVVGVGAAIGVLVGVHVLRVVWTEVGRVEHAVLIVVGVRAAVRVVGAVFVFRVVGARVGRVGDAVLVAVGRRRERVRSRRHRRAAASHQQDTPEDARARSMPQGSAHEARAGLAHARAAPLGSRAMAVSPRLLAVPASVLVVRAALLAFAPAVAAPGLLLALDVAALLVLALAAVFGRVIGAGFGSTVFTFVGVGLPIAGLGALTEVVAGREASNLSGMLALLGVGVGFCLAGPAREDRFTQGWCCCWASAPSRWAASCSWRPTGSQRGLWSLRPTSSRRYWRSRCAPWWRRRRLLPDGAAETPG